MTKLFRETGTRDTKKGFFIVAEGERTEVNYFNRLKSFFGGGLIRTIRAFKGGKKNDAQHLCKKANDIESDRSNDIQDGDEIWIVSDHDGRDHKPLFEWESQSERRSVAISSPKFELWLAMHFDKCAGVKTPDECDRRLKKYVPKYEKNCQMDWVDLRNVQTAIENAKEKDCPACRIGSVPKDGTTTVYRLVVKIVSASNQSIL